MKYVAFIDTLGFREKISDISHDDAKSVIMHFNREIYNLWLSLGFKGDSDNPKAKEGKLNIFMQWKIYANNLAPLAYGYTIDR